MAGIQFACRTKFLTRDAIDIKGLSLFSMVLTDSLGSVTVLGFVCLFLFGS